MQEAVIYRKVNSGSAPIPFQSPDEFGNFAINKVLYVRQFLEFIAFPPKEMLSIV
jgi:hypothetical protein